VKPQNNESETSANDGAGPMLVSQSELRSVFGIRYCADWLKIIEAQGRFPQRVRLGGNRIAYVAAEVRAWIEARIAERPPLPLQTEPEPSVKSKRA